MTEPNAPTHRSDFAVVTALRALVAQVEAFAAAREIEETSRVSLARELAFLLAEASKASVARAHPSDLRWHYLIFLSRCRGTPVLHFLLERPELFEALEAFALSPAGPSNSSFQLKKIDDLEVHELFLHLAEKILKERRETTRALTEIFFDLKTLQAQAMETKYRRNRTDIRYAWARVRKFADGTGLFEDFKGARLLRSRLKSFLDL